MHVYDNRTNSMLTELVFGSGHIRVAKVVHPEKFGVILSDTGTVHDIGPDKSIDPEDVFDFTSRDGDVIMLFPTQAQADAVYEAINGRF